MTATEDELDLRLSRADRAVSLQLPDVISDRLLVATRREATRRRRIRVGVIAGVLSFTVAGAGLAGPAAADAIRHFLAQSSWHPKAGGEILPNSEWVNVDAPDLRDYIDSVYETSLPLAPGQTRASVVDLEVKAWAGMTGVTQEVGLRSDMERTVYSAWICEWIAADDAHDQTRKSAAAGVIAEAPTWPATLATDGSGGTASMRLFSQGISAGDRDSAEAVAQWDGLACWDGIDREAMIAKIGAEGHAIWAAAHGTNE